MNSKPLIHMSTKFRCSQMRFLNMGLFYNPLFFHTSQRASLFLEISLIQSHNSLFQHKQIQLTALSSFHFNFVFVSPDSLRMIHSHQHRTAKHREGREGQVSVPLTTGRKGNLPLLTGATTALCPSLSCLVYFVFN